jgi:hypothetical protein
MDNIPIRFSKLVDQIGLWGYGNNYFVIFIMESFFMGISKDADPKKNPTGTRRDPVPKCSYGNRSDFIFRLCHGSDYTCLPERSGPVLFRDLRLCGFIAFDMCQ